MKRFLQHRSNRWGYDGWGVQVNAGEKPKGIITRDDPLGVKGSFVLEETVSTTREEVRQIRREMNSDFFSKTKIVKVKINVEAI